MKRNQTFTMWLNVNISLSLSSFQCVCVCMFCEWFFPRCVFTTRRSTAKTNSCKWPLTFESKSFMRFGFFFSHSSLCLSVCVYFLKKHFVSGWNVSFRLHDGFSSFLMPFRINTVVSICWRCHYYYCHAFSNVYVYVVHNVSAISPRGMCIFKLCARVPRML